MHTAPNGKRYIGTTYRKPEYRWGVSGKNYSNNEYFWRAIQKYGWDNFQHEILYTNLGKAEACELEKDLIAKYNSADARYGYNLSTGGELSAYGSKRSKIQREHYRQSKLGDKNPQYNKHPWNYGKSFDEASKQKMSQSHLGQPAWNKGLHLSDEYKERLRKASLGKVYVNDGERELCIPKEELQFYLNNGYVRGYIVQRSHKYKNM